MHRHALERLFLFVFLILAVAQHHVTFGYRLGNDPTRRAEYLDPYEKFLLEWEPLWSSGRIVFNLTVQTKGYVSLGLTGSANEATSGGVDLLIAGVFGHGKVYFLDQHSYRGGAPQMDQSQDYTIHAAWESKTHTFISFSRALDSCDPHDYPITDNKLTLLWAYGEEDNHELSWTYAKRGSYEVYLLDQDYSPRIIRDSATGEPRLISQEKLDTWTISRRVRLPNNETAYFCSMHRGPRLQRKHHVVGFDIHFPNQQSRERVHHLILFKCNAPRGLSPGIFEPFVGGQGQPCYMNARPSTNGPLPTHFCTELYLGWALGGRSFFNPPHVGFPLGQSPNEYYMVQLHYDNPQMQPNVLVDVRIDVFYTNKLRKHDAGMMGISHDIPGLAPSLIVPPATQNHRIFGHCSPQCTQRMLPVTGINVFAGILHSHTAGRRLRLRHFSRKDPNNEQPWVLYDDNYSNNYQQFRHLHQERKVLRGDQLTAECTYDTTGSNGSVVGGYSTKQEMCIVFIVYYNKIWDYNMCRSEIVSDEFRQRFIGVRNVTWVESQLDWVVTENGKFTGLTVQQISDNYINWDGRLQHELQRFHESHPHAGKCSRDLYARSPIALQALMQSGAATGPVTNNVPTNLNTPDDFSSLIGYPHKARHFVPPKTCSYRGWYTLPLL